MLRYLEGAGQNARRRPGSQTDAAGGSVGRPRSAPPDARALAGLEVNDTTARWSSVMPSAGLQRVYDQHSYLPQMKRALEQWAVELKRIVTVPRTNNVVRLRGQGHKVRLPQVVFTPEQRAYYKKFHPDLARDRLEYAGKVSIDDRNLERLSAVAALYLYDVAAEFEPPTACGLEARGSAHQARQAEATREMEKRRREWLVDEVKKVWRACSGRVVAAVTARRPASVLPDTPVPWWS